MEELLLQQILDQSYTQNQALKLLSEIKEKLVSQIFGNSETTITYSAFVEDFVKFHSKEFNHENIYQIFEAVEKKIKALEPLIIYLPITLAEAEVVKLYLFIRKNFQNKLLEIKTDPLLLGGAAFVWQGVYKDYSLRSILANNHLLISQIIPQFKIKSYGQ